MKMVEEEAKETAEKEAEAAAASAASAAARLYIQFKFFNLSERH